MSRRSGHYGIWGSRSELRVTRSTSSSAQVKITRLVISAFFILHETTRPPTHSTTSTFNFTFGGLHIQNHDNRTAGELSRGRDRQGKESGQKAGHSANHSCCICAVQKALRRSLLVRYTIRELYVRDGASDGHCTEDGGKAQIMSRLTLTHCTQIFPCSASPLEAAARLLYTSRQESASNAFYSHWQHIGQSLTFNSHSATENP